MKKYLVIIEKGDRNMSAYAPDVPGCAAVGDTVEETLANMAEALEFHFEGMAEDNDPIPEPTSMEVGYVNVRVPEPTAKRKSA